MYEINNLSKTKRIICFSYALVGFIALNPYFTWRTYGSGLFSKLQIGFSLMIVLLLIVYYKDSKKVSYKKVILGISFYLIYLYLHMTGLGKTVNLNGIIANFLYGFVIINFIILNDKEKQLVYVYFKKIFAISLISGIVIFLFLNLGFELPHNVLKASHPGKAARGLYYLHFPGSVFFTSSTRSYFRLSGMFDEPGVVGTIAALILAGDSFRIKGKKANIIILVGGLLSFSLAFYILTIIGTTIKYLTKGSVKLITFLLVLLTILYILLTVETDNYLINRYIQNRIFVEDQIIVLNRTKETFDYEFDSFLNGKNRYVLLGYGHGMATRNQYMAGSYSYKMLIYDYGFVGFALLVGWIIFSSLFMNKMNIKMYSMLLIFLISMYQRPYILTIYFMILLFGGYSNLKSNVIESVNKNYRKDI